MVQELNRCLVCNGDVSPVHFAVHPTEKIACRVCGEYYVSHELAEDGIDSRALRADQRYLFQAWIKRRPLSGQPPPVVTSDSCKSIVQEPQDFSPAEKSEQLLLAYAELCKLPGGTCRAQSRDRKSVV